MLPLFLLLAIFCSQVACKAFGHTVEYRFEYDPKKSDRPIIEWRYDDLVGRRSSSHDRHTQQHDIRKAPRKYYSRSEDETVDEIPHRAFPKWINERISRSDNRRMENEELVDEMAAELRRQSEAIIASHFPNFPFSFHQPQPSYTHYYSGY